MKIEEQRVSKKFKIVLVWQSEETMNNGTKLYRFIDEKTNDTFAHYQILPSKCANPAAAKMARAFISKLRKYNVGDRLRVEAVYREMQDGCIFRDVDNVLYKMPK